MPTRARSIVHSIRKAVHTRLQAPQEEERAPPATKKDSAPVSQTVVNSLSSVEGISKAAVPLFGMWLLYKAVPPIVDYFRDLKEESEHVDREKAKALRNLVETKLREDKKDTAAIHKQVRKDWIEQERKKVPPRPKSVRGHWEGNVFVPDAEQTRGKK